MLLIQKLRWQNLIFAKHDDRPRSMMTARVITTIHDGIGLRSRGIVVMTLAVICCGSGHHAHYTMRSLTAIKLLLRLSGLLILCNNLLLYIGWNFLVLSKFHGERASALSDRAQVRRIAQHLSLGSGSRNLLYTVLQRSHAHHTATLGVDVAHHIAHIAFGDGNDHVHHRFQ